jgi:hypothetical protein
MPAEFVKPGAFSRASLIRSTVVGALAALLDDDAPRFLATSVNIGHRSRDQATG